MGSCENCKYQNLDQSEYPCSGCSHNAVDNFIPITNADRIRNMSDEELEKFIHACQCNALFGSDCSYPYCEAMNGKLCFGIENNRDLELQEWLQKEVDTGD